MASARVTLDIDQRVEHIATQVSMGASQADVVAEQYQQLLCSFSTLCDVDLNGINCISQHLVSTEVFSRPQLLAFSVSLRAAASAKRTKKGKIRSMQRNDVVEHCLTNMDWKQLQELGAKTKQTSDPLENIIAARLHKCGLVCPDVDTLKRASGIVQACMITTTAKAADKRSICKGVRTKLKKLDDGAPWPFEYIEKYPRSSFELPDEVFTHAYGDDKPIAMPDDIDHTMFKLIVADTKYNTPRKDQPSKSDALVPFVPIGVGSPSPMQQTTMHGGPFAQQMAQALMQGLQNMGTPSTCGQFQSRFPMQIKNRKAAFEAEYATPVVQDVTDDELDERDDLEKLEAQLQLGKKASNKITAELREEAKAEAEAKAAADAAAKKTGKKKPVKEQPEAPAAKMKAGKGKGAAPKAKGKAAAPKAKAKGKPSIFDINSWIAAHVTRAEAKSEPKRKNFVSNAHKRSKTAAGLCGVDDVQSITKQARVAAGELHDSVHT